MSEDATPSLARMRPWHNYRHAHNRSMLCCVLLLRIILVAYNFGRSNSSFLRNDMLLSMITCGKWQQL